MSINEPNLPEFSDNFSRLYKKAYSRMEKYWKGYVDYP